MTGRMKVLMWTGLGLCVLGAVGLVVGAVVDVEGADPWASVAGGVAGLLGLAVAVFAFTRDASAPAGPSVTASGARAVAAGRDIGSVSTGDNDTLTPPNAPAPPAPTGAGDEPPARNVTASGDRSVAAGRDIHNARTGDGPAT
ncbi:hypothetical protein ACWC10_20110 [Streptomyces sp. NPDC001595]|uniref:hypothetical protein n=1 Tax=Streptomyces sp. NPDC001532 TaxID=3154520 RepID=UPI0033317980